MAAERTLMAWVRTALSMIGFGFTLGKLLQTLAEHNRIIRGPAGKIWTAEGVCIALISLGTLSLLAAIFDHRRRVKLLCVAGFSQWFSLSVIVAAALVVLGVMALLALEASF